MSHGTPRVAFDGELLRRLREGKGWKLRDLARRIGVTASSLCRAENGIGDLSFAHAVAAADAFGLAVTAFVRRGASR